VARYRDLAVRTAWLVTRSSADAEDAAQEAFVKAYRALPRFRSRAPFRPWILRIAMNEARNRARSTRRREALAVRVAEAGVAAERSAESAALAHGEAEALAAAVSRLDERDRLVIAYRYFFELSEAETAEALGVRPGTVKSRLSRALARLRVQLGTEVDA